MKRIVGLFSALLLLVLASSAFAQPYGYPGRNPCATPESFPQSAPINIGSATTAQIIAAPSSPSLFGGATSQIFVCTWDFTETGTSPTYAWVTGTGTNCATGQTSLTAVIPSVSATAPNLPPQEQATVMVVPAGQALCLTTGGTTPSAQGFVTYAVQ